MREETSLPTTWSFISLADLGRWYGGGTPSKAVPAYWENGSIPWVSPKDMKVQHIRESQDYITEAAVSSSATNLVPKDSVLLVTRSGILRHSLPVAVNKVDCAINQDLKALVPFPGIDPDYIAYAMRASEADILGRAVKGGTTVQSVEFPELLGYVIPLAPTREQSRIVAEIEKELSRLDAATASLQKIQANLRRYRAAVLKAACEGRLVPTEAELARVEGRKQQTSNGSTPTLPDLPKGWEWARLGDILTLLRNGIATKPDATVGWPILRISSVRPLRVDLTDVRYLPRESGPFDDYVLEEGDLLFTRYNGNRELVGVCAEVRNIGARILHPDKLIRGKVDQRICHPSFLEVVLNTGVSREILASKVRTTAGQSGISGSDLKALPVPLAPLEEQLRIAIEVQRQFSLIAQIESAIEANLSRTYGLRQSILSQAFQGRLVPQDPSDEPASVLLERIRQAKASRTSEPRARKTKPKPELAPPRPRKGANDEPPEGVAAYSPGREPRVESAPLIPKPPEGATALPPRRGSGNHDDPQTRGSRPGLYAAAPSGGSKSTRMPPPPVRAAEPEPQEAHFLELDREEQLDILWQALLGKGTLDKDVAIRTAADELRSLDLVRFQRLRHDGPLYGTIGALIERGVRDGSFDRPRRGHVRAVLTDPKDYTDEVWQQCLLAVVGDEPAEIEGTLRAAAEWARETMGLDYARLREDGVILTGLREALEVEVRAGRIVRRGGMIRRATD